MIRRMLFIADNASRPFDRDAHQALQLFRQIRAQGIDAWMIYPQRCQTELRQALPHDRDFQRIVFVESSWTQTILGHLCRCLPRRFQERVSGPLFQLHYQLQARKIAQFLVKTLDLQLVFQVTPSAASAVSAIYDVGVPVVMGPLRGTPDRSTPLRFPPSPWSKLTEVLTGLTTRGLHRLFPGKLRATTLIMADQFALDALPVGYQGQPMPLLTPAAVPNQGIAHLSATTDPAWFYRAEAVIKILHKTLDRYQTHTFWNEPLRPLDCLFWKPSQSVYRLAANPDRVRMIGHNRSSLLGSDQATTWSRDSGVES